MPEDTKPPYVNLKLTDPATFNVEIDFETPNLEFARLMLNTATKVIEKMQADLDAADFGAKMNAAAAAHRAMLKNPNQRM